MSNKDMENCKYHGDFDKKLDSICPACLNEAYIIEHDFRIIDWIRANPERAELLFKMALKKK